MPNRCLIYDKKNTYKLIYSSKHSIISFILRPSITSLSYSWRPNQVYSPQYCWCRIFTKLGSRRGWYRWIDRLQGLNYLNKFKYTHPYLFQLRPFSFSNPLCAHFPNTRTVFINNQILKLIYRRFSHFPLQRWSTPASPTFVNTE